MNLKEMQKYANALSEIRVKCNCSHTLYFPAYGPEAHRYVHIVAIKSIEMIV